MAESALDVEQLRKTYGWGRQRLVAVNDVSFSVRPGEIVGLLGPNGAGKTTLIKSILHLVEPDAGRVRLFGRDIPRNRHAMYRVVTAVLEGARNTYWRMSIRENLAFFAGMQGINTKRRRAFHDELIERFGLMDKADTVVNQLSTGMKQKVAVACAFARETEILFLDEPTLGLDLHASHTLRTELKQLAADHRRTIILSSHDMDVVRDLCQRVIIVNQGTVVVDDEVDNLVALFRTEAYNIHIGSLLDDVVRRRLEQSFAISNWSVVNGETRFNANLDEANRLYELIDELRTAEVPLIGVAKSEPDLAQVFLHVTQAESVKSEEAAQ